MTLDVIVSWLLTYTAHSTLLFAAIWVLARSVSGLAHAARNRLWRAALVGALATTSVQVALDVGTFDMSLDVIRSNSGPSTGTIDGSIDAPGTATWPVDVILEWLSFR